MLGPAQVWPEWTTVDGHDLKNWKNLSIFVQGKMTQKQTDIHTILACQLFMLDKGEKFD